MRAFFDAIALRYITRPMHIPAERLAVGCADNKAPLFLQNFPRGIREVPKMTFVPAKPVFKAPPVYQAGRKLEPEVRQTIRQIDAIAPPEVC